MSDEIGGISLDDIISAAMNDLEDSSFQNKHKAIKEFHIFNGDFPIVNYEYKVGKLYAYNQINGSRDGHMQFSKGFFDTIEIVLSDEQRQQLFKQLSSLNLSDWETDKTVFDKMDCPGFCVEAKFSCKFEDGDEYVCYPVQPLPCEFRRLFELLRSFGLPKAYGATEKQGTKPDEYVKVPDKSQSINIGGVSLDDIIKAASYDISPNENDENEDVKRAKTKIENTSDAKDSQIQVVAQNDIIQTTDSDIDQTKDSEATNIDKDIKKGENKAKVVATLRKFYLFDMLYRTVKAKNWGLLVWIFINFIIIEFFLAIAGPTGLIAGPVIYIVSLAIALSPIGEFVLRQSNACRAIKDKKIEAKIQPIFDKVYAEAMEKNPEISPKVKLFMCDEECENAFATGRRTLCITKGLAKMDEEHIAAIMAHEFGHLAHRDTDCLLIVVVGNLLMTVITGIIGFICNIFGWIGDSFTENTTLGKILPFSLITRAISFLLTTVFMFLWTKLGALFCMKGNRNQEFQADRYAAELGYAQKLIDAFVELEAAPAPKGLWATLTSTHPDDADRIVKLNEYIEASQLH